MNVASLQKKPKLIVIQRSTGAKDIGYNTCPFICEVISYNRLGTVVTFVFLFHYTHLLSIVLYSSSVQYYTLFQTPYDLANLPYLANSPTLLTRQSF